MKENNKRKGEHFRFDIHCSFTRLGGVCTHYTKLSLQKNTAHEALERNKKGKFYQDEAMSDIESKVSGGCAQKVSVMEGDKVSSFLSSLCVKLQFQIIIQYSGEHKG